MPRIKKCADNRVKWAHLCDIDYRTKVGSAAWERVHPDWRVRKLSAWRRLHDIYGSHPSVRGAALRQGQGSPSSGMPLRKMVALAVKNENRNRDQ